MSALSPIDEKEFRRFVNDLCQRAKSSLFLTAAGCCQDYELCIQFSRGSVKYYNMSEKGAITQYDLGPVIRVQKIGYRPFVNPDDEDVIYESWEDVCKIRPKGHATPIWDVLETKALEENRNLVVQSILQPKLADYLVTKRRYAGVSYSSDMFLMLVEPKAE